jgi:hypothetical protein
MTKKICTGSTTMFSSHHTISIIRRERTSGSPHPHPPTTTIFFILGPVRAYRKYGGVVCCGVIPSDGWDWGKEGDFPFYGCAWRVFPIFSYGESWIGSIALTPSQVMDMGQQQNSIRVAILFPPKQTGSTSLDCEHSDTDAPLY